jgi:phosphoribosyl 1,2-cyclic phosphodiesterase
MRLASLGSGSKGNATLVESDNTCILIDCGFSLKDTSKRLGRLGRSVEDLDAILVTHEHSDHIKGVATLAKKNIKYLYI